jgi:predicted 2-oxoglutarate/Fe(II)-dependent dioxygenase YbiX/peroxiredoxin
MNDPDPPASPRRLHVGDPAPWFIAACTFNAAYHFDTVAGRTVVLSFLGTSAEPRVVAAAQAFAAETFFDDEQACWFGVFVDPRDRDSGRWRERLPGIRWFWDLDGAVSRAYGALENETPPLRFRPFTLVLDERLRVLATWRLDEDGAAHAAEVMAFVRARAPLPAGPASVEGHAPVLVIPRVFEPKLCAELIACYERDGGKDSGYMQERGGFTVPVIDHRHKRRRDAEIADEGLKNAAMRRVKQRIAPEMARAFAFDATRIERHIVACYDGSEGGWFRPHRDNTTKGTAHRRFAVTLNLNGDYDGGDLRFPEFGQRTYRAPPGGAVVFSCSLLHEATPVTRGQRFAYLPFLYDEAAARVREANQGFLKHDVVDEVR